MRNKLPNLLNNIFLSCLSLAVFFMTGCVLTDLSPIKNKDTPARNTSLPLTTRTTGLDTPNATAETETMTKSLPISKNDGDDSGIEDDDSTEGKDDKGKKADSASSLRKKVDKPKKQLICRVCGCENEKFTIYESKINTLCAFCDKQSCQEKVEKWTNALAKCIECEKSIQHQDLLWTEEKGTIIGKHPVCSEACKQQYTRERTEAHYAWVYEMNKRDISQIVEAPLQQAVKLNSNTGAGTRGSVGGIKLIGSLEEKTPQRVYPRAQPTNTENTKRSSYCDGFNNQSAEKCRLCKKDFKIEAASSQRTVKPNNNTGAGTRSRVSSAQPTNTENTKRCSYCGGFNNQSAEKCKVSSKEFIVICWKCGQDSGFVRSAISELYKKRKSVSCGKCHMDM